MRMFQFCCSGGPAARLHKLLAESPERRWSGTDETWATGAHAASVTRGVRCCAECDAMHFPMVYNPSGHLLAVLDNADAIGYELQRNDLSTASFTLPADDPNRAHCQTGNLVRLPGDGGGTGVYRIAGQDGEETAQGGEITYSLEHVMATLLDDVLLGEHDLTGTPLTEAIQYILDRQTTKRWVLGRVEPEGTAAIKCENTPLLTALLQLGQGIPEEYTWEFDCGNHTAGPWTLNLLRAEESPGCGIHYGRSLTSIRKTVDASALITRLYALGAGTGEERTDIRPANGGLPYIDADTIGTWGVRCGVLTDTGLTDPAALLEKARRALEQYKNPYITYTATAVDLAAVTGDPWDTYRPGKMVRVMDEEHGVAFVSRIVTVRKTDVWDAASLEITIANAPRDALDSMTEMQEQAETLAEEQNETKTQVSGAQRDVTKMQESLHWMAGQIDETTGNLEGVSLRLDGIGKQIELQAGTISAQGELISGAQVNIDGLKKRVESIAGDIDQLTGDLTGARELIDGANQRITEQAGKISAQGELIEGAQQTIDGLKGEISQKVSKDGLISEINQSAEKIRISAGKIDLDGYVTAKALEADIAEFKREYAGQFTTSHLYAEDGHFATLNVSGTLTADVIMGGSNVNLSIHYHEFTVDGGTVTIGGPSATRGSFNIADTQFYKDGVSAAERAVTVRWWEDEYFSDEKRVHVTATLSSGVVQEYDLGVGGVYNDGYKAGLAEGGGGDVKIARFTTTWTPSDPKNLQATITLTNNYQDTYPIDAGNVYNAGHSDGYDDGYAAGKIAGGSGISIDDITTNYNSSFPKSLTVNVFLSNGEHLSRSIDVTDVYDKGYSDVTLSGPTWGSGGTTRANNNFTISASNGKSISRTLYLTGGTSWTNGVTTVSMREGSSSGTTRARLNVPAPS